MKIFHPKIEHLPEKLKGRFTAIKLDGSLKIFRDIFGSKPIYFIEKNGVHISDRIKPLLEFTDAEVSDDVALDYLHSGLVAHRRETFFSGIKQLRPSETLKYEGMPEISSDYSFLGNTKGTEVNIREELQKKMPEGDFVCPVSGGLDSSIMASLSDNADFLYAGFDIDTGDNEYYQELKKSLGLEVTELEFQVEDLIEFIDESLEINEYPAGMIAIQALQMLHCSIHEKGKSRVVDGAGADEIFLGYPRFIPYYIAGKFEEGLFQGLTAVKNHILQLDYHGRKEILRLVTPYSNDFEIPEIAHKPDYKRPENLEEAFEKNFRVYNFPHILHARDKSTEFYELDAVYPFISPSLLNHEDLIENFEDGLTKRPLRDTFEKDLPDKIVNRKKKTGFIHMDNTAYTNSVWRKFEEVFSSEKFRGRNLFDGELFYRSFQSNLQSFFKCYRFYCMEKWMRKFID
jgi:asparagine synthetase B (glutamine-hydrolysing)